MCWLQRQALTARRTSVAALRPHGLLLALASLLGPQLVHAQGFDRAFVDGHAFDAAVAIEILPLSENTASRDALADALVEINELEALFDPDADFDRGLGALNRAAGKGPLELDDRALEALRKALLFCLWSENAHGPIGGVLYSSWGLRRSVGGPPSQVLLKQAIESAGCERLVVDLPNRVATLMRGSRVDLWGFARGFAVDRAVLRLQQAGATSGWVQIGDVVRVFATEDHLPGWQVELDATKPNDALIERLILKNQAVAMVSTKQSDTNTKRLRIAGKDWVPYLDQRTGAPLGDKTATFVVAETAIDAFGLAVALFVQNSLEGEFRSGQLKPTPATKWLLGSETAPIESSRGWADLEKWTPSNLVARP